MQPGWCQPVRQEFMENECEALQGVAYPGVRDYRRTLNTKTGYDDDSWPIQPDILSPPLLSDIQEAVVAGLATSWHQKSMKAQVVNSHVVCDSTIRQPGFDLPRQQWSLLNHFRMEQGHCGACRKKMATYRHWSVSLWRDSDDIPHCRILSRQNWMAAYLGYIPRMKTVFRGWPVMVHNMHTKIRIELSVFRGVFGREKSWYLHFSTLSFLGTKSPHRELSLPWNFCSVENSLPGSEKSKNFRSMELSHPWNFRSSGANVPRTFAPWNFRSTNNFCTLSNFRSCGTFAPVL